MMRNARARGRHGTKAAGAILVACVIAAGCGGGSKESTDSTTTTVEGDASTVADGTPVQGGNLTIAVESETAGWNPAAAQWAAEGNFIGSSMYEPLAVYNSNGEAVPWLAESITPNDDATEWTITVRQGITFQDGTPLDAQVVIDNLAFENSGAALASIITSKWIGTPVLVDQYTLKIPVNIQWGSFDTYLASAFGYMMAPSMLKEKPYGAENPIGTGAYQFEKLEKDRFLRVKAFDGYWGGPCTLPDPAADLALLCSDLGIAPGQKNGPWLDSMEFRPIPDSVVRSQALEAGDVDLILNTRPGITAGLRENYQVVTDYSSEQNFVTLSAAKPPFDNVHARRALAFATDQAALVEQLGAGEDIPIDTSPYEETNQAWGGLAPDQTGYPLYDPAKAEEELALYKADMDKAGTPVASLDFQLDGVASLDDLEVMQALADQWKKVGINATINSIKKEAIIEIQVGGKFQAIISRNYAWPDPDGNYIFWANTFVTPPIVLNFGQFYTDSTQDALDLGRASQDPAFRRQAYDGLIKERNENAADIWLFNVPWTLIGDKDIRGMNAFRNLGISGYYAKPYVAGFWLAPS